LVQGWELAASWLLSPFLENLLNPGDIGIDVSLEFWVNGIDDGQHKYKSNVLCAIWNTLKDAGIGILYPHRVVEIKGDMKGLKL
jgi:small-conductance mechanosensitive channel